MLTPLQADTLRFIASYQGAHDGATPSFERIARHLRLRSTEEVERILSELGKQGRITRTGPFWRSIRIKRMPAEAA